jgi:SnoaL-like domain
MPRTNSNLMTILRAIPAWLQDGDVAGLNALFAEDAVWQGIQPGQICEGRREIVGRLGRAGSRGLRLTGIEVREVGDRIVVHAESPDLPETEDLAAGDPRTLAFTFRKGVVVRLETLAPRAG